MSSSNINNPQGAYPSSMGVGNGPATASKPSTSVDLPPNNDARLEQADNNPATTSNPVKMGSGSVSKGTSSIGKEGSEEHGHGTIAGSGTQGESEQKGLGDKIKDKLNPST